MVEQKGLGFEPIYERTDITDSLHELFNFNTDLEIINYKKMKKILNNVERCDKYWIKRRIISNTRICSIFNISL